MDNIIDMAERTIDSTTVFDGRIIRVKVDNVMLPDGRPASREVVCHNGGCSVVPITKQGEVILVKQFRYPYMEEVYEIPAGKLELGEDPADCAVRELREETGCKAEKVIDLGYIYPTPGYSNEKIYMYLALNLERGEMCLDDGEFLVLESFSIDDALKMIADSRIRDAKTIIGILRYHNEFRTR